MTIPIHVRCAEGEASPEIQETCRQEAEKLERFSDRITSCRVVVDEPHRRHHRGNLHRVRVLLAVPGTELVVDRDPPEDHAREDVHVAIRQAFDRARRQLEDHVRVQRGDVKSHATKPPARPEDAAR